MIILTIVGVFIAQTLIGLLSVIYIKRKAEAIIREWVTPDAMGKSKIGIAIDNTGSIVGSAAAASIMGTLMQKQSNLAREANKLTGDVVEGQLEEQSPLVGLAMQMIPGLRKGIRKNPTAVLALSEALKGLGGAHGNGSNAPGKIASVQDRINRGGM